MMDNIWETLKEMPKFSNSSKKVFWSDRMNEFSQIDDKICELLFLSMEKRIEGVIKNEGHLTKY